MSEATKIYEKLSEPFPPEMLKSRKKGGVNLTYVPVAEVIARLNNVLGVHGWSVVEADAWREPDHPNWVISKVTLETTINGATVRKVGFGGQDVSFYKGGQNKGQPLDLGDEFKGAMSDALKKAATQLGIALDLARDEDAMALESEEREHSLKASAQDLTAIEEYKDSLEEGTDEFNEFKDWWVTNVGATIRGGRVTADQAAATMERFDITVDLRAKPDE